MGYDALTWVWQCMDVLLDQNYTIPSDVGCTNPQGQPPNSSSTSTSTPSPTSTHSSGGGVISTGVGGFLELSLAGALAVVLA